ncbi:MAG TPA: hypothetical protein VFK07_02810, partial [Candidatus Paceibacterota bacterium]|nr:hypothetical protein [Candidatus Paceibacterota bacterium]
KLGQWRRIEMVTNSVTYIPDLLRVTALLMEREASGIRNIVQSEPLSWVGAVSRYREVLGPQFEGSRELVLPDERRSNAVLAPSVDIEMMLTPLETAVSSSLEEIRRRQLYLAA